MTRLYLDYNATAPLRPEAREAMIEALAEVGNASSVHREGRAAHHRIEDARVAVAALVGGDPKAVTFTSGGTEANNTVLTPDWTILGKPVRCDRLLVGATEHPSVLAGGRFPADRVGQIPVDGEGIVDLAVLAHLLSEATGQGQRALVSVMAANNETAVIQPVAEVARIAHDAGAIFHTDAVQAAGKIPVDIAALGVDVLTLSAHKIGGPQGAGAIVRGSDDLSFQALTTGGGQEKRTRAGTENVAAIAGFGVAASLAASGLAAMPDLAGLRDRIAAEMAEGGRKVTVFSGRSPRLPQTLCAAVEGIAAETLLIALDLEGVAVSSGSACSSGKVAPSHVLSAMAVPQNIAKGAIRISLGWDSKETDLDLFSTAWRRVLKHLPSDAVRAA
jgi:cysteine desulfurase